MGCASSIDATKGTHEQTVSDRSTNASPRNSLAAAPSRDRAATYADRRPSSKRYSSTTEDSSHTFSSTSLVSPDAQRLSCGGNLVPLPLQFGVDEESVRSDRTSTTVSHRTPHHQSIQRSPAGSSTNMSPGTRPGSLHSDADEPVESKLKFKQMMLTALAGEGESPQKKRISWSPTAQATPMEFPNKSM